MKNQKTKKNGLAKISRLPIRRLLVLLLALQVRCWAGENLIQDGNAESETSFLKGGSAVDADISNDNPLPDDDSGKACFKFSVRPNVPGTRMVWWTQPLFIDRSKTYRISARVYTDAENVLLQIGGDGYGVDKAQVKKDNGYPWGYSLKQEDGRTIGIVGPTFGWITIESTIGPEESISDYIWHPEVFMIDLTFRISGGGDSPIVYVDNLIMEEVDSSDE